MTKLNADVLIIGSGIAGLSAALELADKATVIVATKRELFESNTRYAQGGVSSVLSPEDSFDAHVADTLEAAAVVCSECCRTLRKNGPAAVRRLVEWGVSFDRDEEGTYDLAGKGGILSVGYSMRVT